MTKGMCGLRRRSGNKHLWLASVVISRSVMKFICFDGGKKYQVPLPNLVATPNSSDKEKLVGLL